MTNEKARDFFSAYYEGSLEPGLCVSLEQKLSVDGSLKDEYQAFERAMSSLDTLKFEEITIPDDLHERISARLDRDIYERKRNAKPALGVWLRGLTLAGVAAAAIIGTIFAMNARSEEASAGVGAPLPAKAHLVYTIQGDQVALKYAPASSKTVVITDGEGKVLSRNVVGGDQKPDLKSVLENPLPNAAVFGIQIEGEDTPSYVVVYGSERTNINHGEGTMVDLAKAVADFYHTHVMLKTGVPTERTSWTFSTSDVVTEVSRVVGSNYTVTLLKDGMLEIERSK
jgi:hypothetical protein